MGFKFLNHVPNWEKTEANGVTFRTQLKFYSTERALYFVEEYQEPGSFETSCF